MTGAAWFLVFLLHGQPQAIGPFLYQHTCEAALERARALAPHELAAGDLHMLDEWFLPLDARCERRGG